MKCDYTKFIPVITVENWEDFEEVFKGCGPIVFRGQGNSSWDLTSNYERVFGVNASRESSMLRRCITEGHLFVKEPPDSNDTISWLAEMQHYGAPTRLLDVTRSKYIALFFALMGMKDNKDGAVWAFDTLDSDNCLYESLKESLSRIEINRPVNGFGDGIMLYQHIGWQIADAIVRSEPMGKIFAMSNDLKHCKRALNAYYRKGLIIHLIPKRMNRRLQAQQGEFLFPFNINRTFVQNLLGSMGGSDFNGKLCDFDPAKVETMTETTSSLKVIKSIIPYSLKDEFIECLLERNISYQTLFPDEMGFMQSLQFQRNRKRTVLKLRNSSEEMAALSGNEFDLFM